MIGAICGIQTPTGSTAFPSTFATGDYCSSGLNNLILQAGSWVITALTGAKFDAWTSYLATTTGCATMLSPSTIANSATTTAGTAQILLNEIT